MLVDAQSKSDIFAISILQIDEPVIRACTLAKLVPCDRLTRRKTVVSHGVSELVLPALSGWGYHVVCKPGLRA